MNEMMIYSNWDQGIQLFGIRESSCFNGRCVHFTGSNGISARYGVLIDQKRKLDDH